MNRKPRGLGKSLDALLAGAGLSSESDVLIADKEASGISEIAINKIVPGKYQPRRTFKEEELEELAQSIQAQGVLQPIIVRFIHDRYEIIAGERRWRASQKASLTHIPAIIRQVTDSDAMLIALIENIQRSDLNILEEAMALNRLSEEFELTHAEISETVGKSRSTVTNILRVLTLNEEVKKLLSEGKVELGHAKVLLGVKGHLQSEVARTISERGLSVREAEQLLSERSQGKVTKRKEPKVDPNVISLQNTLSDKLAARVEIQCDAQGKGKLIIHYHSLEELDGILSRF